jgi:dienelactone hydrolase
MLFCSCSNKQTGERITLSDLSPVNIPAESDSVIEIKNWLAIGPFGFNPLVTDPARSFFHKDLKKYGIEEGLIDENAIEKIQRRGGDVFLLDVPSPQIKLFGYVSNGETKSNFYLVSRIYSAKARDATLIIDASNSYVAWLNGDKLIEVRGKYNLNKVGDRFVNVSLKEGENTLFVKVNRGTNKRSWDLICAVASCQEAKRIFRVNYAGDFVVNPVIDNSLETYTGPYHGGKIEVLNSEGQVVAGDSFHQNTNVQPFALQGLEKLEEGFYKAVLTLEDKRLEEMIYKGDFNTYIRKTKNAIAEINSHRPYDEDLKAAMQRVEFLNNKPGDINSQSETRYINRNKVFWGYSLQRMLRKNALTQLMTYSDEYGETGVFIFNIDDKHKQNIPLVVIIPSALEGNSMVEDWYTGNLDQIETDNNLAARHGYAVAWIYAGGKNYSAIKTEKEITAVIKRLHSEYNIDDQKIFITGDCEGGRRALLQLAASPGRYAACVASSPITLSGGVDGVPIDLLSQMGNVPILLRHGKDDDISPVENSRNFYAEAQKLNMEVEYTEVDGSHINVSKDLHKYVFEFFSQIESKQK